MTMNIRNPLLRKGKNKTSFLGLQTGVDEDQKGGKVAMVFSFGLELEQKSD